jgi:hypothetical protein
MITTLLSILTSGALAAPVPEQPEAGPKGPPPVVMTVKVGPDGLPFIERMVTEYVPEERVEKVQVGNDTVERKVTVRVPVLRQFRLALDSREVQVFTPDGKRVDPRDVRSLVKKTMPVLVSTDGKPVDPFYLQLVKENTLIVVSPQLLNAPEPLPGPNRR